MTGSISLCIATYKRPARLAALLGDLAAQTQPAAQVVIVDNDANGSARPVVDAFRANAPFVLDYAIQPARNIALTRNHTVALATGDWLAFIDDDERAPPGWLATLMDEAQRQSADGLLGPVLPEVPQDAPGWIRAGRFYDFPRMPTGTEVPANQLRFGNVLLRGSLLRLEPGPFDAAYGLTTGEDGDLLLRLRARGGRILWCDEAVVQEPIEPSRLSLRWLVQRAYSGGQEYARKALAGRYGAVTRTMQLRFFADAVAKMLIASLLALPAVLKGRHRAAHWLLRAAANAGKLTAFLGWNYREYQTASASHDP